MFDDIDGLGGPVGHMGLPPDMQEELTPRQEAFAQGVGDTPSTWGKVGDFFSQVKPEDVSSVFGGVGQVLTGQQTLEQLRKVREIDAARAAKERRDLEFQRQLAMRQAQYGGSPFAFAKKNAVWIILGVAIIGAGVWYFTKKRR